MTTTEQPDAGPLARQLVRHAEAITQLRKDLDQLASEITDTAADMLTRLETIEEYASQSAVGPNGGTGWCWRDIGPEASESLWRELTDWVGWVRCRYPLARRIPGCWAQHPEVVEELTALWLAWCAAYTERDASLTGAIDWHDRWLPGLLGRLEHGVFALDCSRQHVDRPESAYAAAHSHGSQ